MKWEFGNMEPISFKNIKVLLNLCNFERFDRIFHFSNYLPNVLPNFLPYTYLPRTRTMPRACSHTFKKSLNEDMSHGHGWLANRNRATEIGQKAGKYI